MWSRSRSHLVIAVSGLLAWGQLGLPARAQAVIGSVACPSDMVAPPGRVLLPLDVYAYCDRPGKNRAPARYNRKNHDWWFCGKNTVRYKLACLEQYGKEHELMDVCYVRRTARSRSTEQVWCELKAR